MRENGYTVSLLHGKDMPPEERDKVMDDFIKGTTAVLITTNVLARGIDILQVTLVINYDIPTTIGNRPDPETYIHRIGRSGRFGRPGVAINFVHDVKSKQDLAFIAQTFKADIKGLPAEDPKMVEVKIREGLKQLQEKQQKEIAALHAVAASRQAAAAASTPAAAAPASAAAAAAAKAPS